MTFLIRLFDRLTLAMAWLGGAAFLLLSFYITFSALGRYTGLFFSQGDDDISAFVLAAACTWPMAYALRVNGHVRIDILYGTLTPVWKEACNVIGNALTAVFAAMLALYGWRLAIESWELDIRSVSMIQTPVFIPQGIVAVGYTILALQAVVLAIAAMRNQVAALRTTRETTR